MRGSGFAREARRRPDLDLMVGPLEAATMEAEDSRSDGSTPEDVEPIHPAELPA
ncbi:MAG: hypothetical protein ACXWEJ_04360 [Actinomycetota bacterium]